ncbi:18975_t:CDS:2 [Dentiscutata erythropus]|uniref:18975_t:CDS:1 n=1 Tax=Dentiscutata erythropus TaxID=1348616 RepID=A0A9N9A0J8_9GLOM|nr:18975_t:CDS:2 [Dentiscutata erythropus]
MIFQEEKRACSLFWIKLTRYWFPLVDDDYKDHDPPDNTGDTSSCNSHVFNETDPTTNLNTFFYYDSGVNFTDGTLLNMPTGVNFQISANNSLPNDSLTTLLSYPLITLVDQELFTSYISGTDQPQSKLSNTFLSDLSNVYFLSPYQRQIVWFDRVKHTELSAASKKGGALSVAKKSSKLAINYFDLSTRIQSLSPLNPLGVNPAQFTATLEIFNQSSTLTTYKETDKASQFKVLTFFTSLGGANAFFMTVYMFLYGKKGPGILPYLIYPFLCCSGPANYIRERFIDQPSHMLDLEKDVDKDSIP